MDDFSGGLIDSAEVGIIRAAIASNSVASASFSMVKGALFCFAVHAACDSTARLGNTIFAQDEPAIAALLCRKSRRDES